MLRRQGERRLARERLRRQLEADLPSRAAQADDEARRAREMDELEFPYVRPVREIAEEAGRRALASVKEQARAGVAAALGTDAAGGLVDRGVDRLADAFRGRWYGNYGGPGYSGGRFLRPDEHISPADLRVPPTDKLDALFRAHDIRYALGATKDTRKARAEALREADKSFIREAARLIRSDQLTLGQRMAAEAAMTGFRAKLASGAGYDPAPLRDEGGAWSQFYRLQLGEGITDEELGIAPEEPPPDDPARPLLAMNQDEPAPDIPVLVGLHDAPPPPAWDGAELLRRSSLARADLEGRLRTLLRLIEAGALDDEDP